MTQLEHRVVIANAPCIVVPSQFDGAAVSRFAADLARACPNGLPPVLDIDLSRLRFVRSTGLVFLSNLTSWVRNKGRMVRFVGATIQNPGVAYLDKAQFFATHCGSRIHSMSTPLPTMKPLRMISNQHVHHWLDTDLVPWLAMQLNISQASLYDYRACISEIFNNIKDHTRFDIGSIVVQHYPKENAIWISIADWGEGIPTTVLRVERHHPTHAAAIIRACEHGFTAQSIPTNRGAGLALLLDNVVQRNRGQVAIFSQHGNVTFRRGATGCSEPHTYNQVGFWPGTLIEIQLRTDMIEEVPNETEDFEW